MKKSINYNNIQFETERLIIRRIKSKDYVDFFNIMSDEKTMTYLSRTITLEEAKQYVDQQSRIDYKNYGGNFAVVLKLENKVIGQFGLNINEKNSIGEINYLFNSNYWHRGYAIETIKEMIDFAFNKINLNRIEADCVIENKSSLNIFNKIHMQYEGTARQGRFNKKFNKYFDVVYYSILKSEYESKK